ncbi:MAG TPA: hypothetical protein VNA25_02425 [Phycisphaerae bacterium]|nr:hypothetical protein [Phycisphaerae bacterium]
MSIAALNNGGCGQAARAPEYQLTLENVADVVRILADLIAILKAAHWAYKKLVPKGDGSIPKALRYLTRPLFLVLLLHLAISDLFMWSAVAGRMVPDPAVTSGMRQLCSFFPLLGLVVSPLGLRHPIRAHRRARALVCAWIENLLLFAQHVLNKPPNADAHVEKVHERLGAATLRLGRDDKILRELKFLVDYVEKLPRRDVRRSILPGLRVTQVMVAASRLHWALRTGETWAAPFMALIDRVAEIGKREERSEMTFGEGLAQALQEMAQEKATNG